MDRNERGKDNNERGEGMRGKGEGTQNTKHKHKHVKTSQIEANNKIQPQGGTGPSATNTTMLPHLHT
jgi:hypothetical protein